MDPYFIVIMKDRELDALIKYDLNILPFAEPTECLFSVAFSWHSSVPPIQGIFPSSKIIIPKTRNYVDVSEQLHQFQCVN
jgi:hypothetical protein